MWLMKKIAQIKEYYRLDREYKIKDAELMQFEESNKGYGLIYTEHQSNQALVVFGPHKEYFGGPNHPCIVKELSSTGNKVYPIMDFDKTFYCPDYKKDKPCEKTDCRWANANLQHFIKEKHRAEIYNQLAKIAGARDTAKKRILGYIR